MSTPSHLHRPAGGKPPMRLLCLERPGETLSTDEAAALCETARYRIHGAISNARAIGREWARVGHFHFKQTAGIDAPAKPRGDWRKASSFKPIPPKCQERFCGRLGGKNPMPLNTNILGGAAVVMSIDRPPVAEDLRDLYLDRRLDSRQPYSDEECGREPYKCTPAGRKALR